MNTIKTILYFSIFRHPLKIDEIHSYNSASDICDTANELEYFIEKGILVKVDKFYVIDNDLDSVSIRLKGSLETREALIKASKRSKFISKFPFVEAVAVSGSLSKGYHDDNSDIDFFVITRPNRLWICRTLLMLFKKIFLFNSRKYFCINYFISSSNLEIEEKNRFTATELKTLIPLRGKDVFKKFYSSNLWINDYFPKFNPDMSLVQNTTKPVFTKTIEYFLNTPIGGAIDSRFYKITIAKWKSKFRNIDSADLEIAFKSAQNISKHHPSNFQKKVITTLNEKYRLFKQKHNIELSEEHA